mmetsp:Transcript_19620/g.32708  ORF Transcript_19620/g.32708 Transcript_19620/m.32708 type:complete len:133 (+) Transcript_19620:46-444(+)
MMSEHAPQRANTCECLLLHADECNRMRSNAKAKRPRAVHAGAEGRHDSMKHKPARFAIADHRPGQKNLSCLNKSQLAAKQITVLKSLGQCLAETKANANWSKEMSSTRERAMNMGETPNGTHKILRWLTLQS